MTKRYSKFKEFNRRDLYTIMLYAIYKLTDDPNYSVLSELMFILQSDDEILDLCSTLGGMTVRIPTVQELKLLVQALAIAETMAECGITMDQAYLILKIKADDKSELRKLVDKIGDIVDGYSSQSG